MLTWTLKPWQRALIARLDVPPNLIREIRPRPVLIEHAIVSNRHSGREQPERPSAAPGGLRRDPRQRAEGRAGRSNAEARARLPQPRQQPQSRNRAEMIEALKPLGFTAIQPEKLSFDEQALTFAEAEMIVCEFGAAMANVMFCRPGTKIVEIIAEGQHDPWSSHLARDARTRARRPVPAPDRGGSRGRAAAREGTRRSHMRST